MYSFARAEQIVSNVRRILNRRNFNTRDVEVYIDYTSLWCYCTQHEDGDIEISIGLYALFNQWRDKDSIKSYLLHEFGHAWIFQRWPLLETKDKTQWRKLFGKYTEEETLFDGLFHTYQHYDESAYVSSYATVSSHEDFAETFMTLTLREPIPPNKAGRKMEFVQYLLDKY